MADMTQAYITGTGAFLPGDPVGKAELAARFGDGTTRETAVRDRVLAANEIRTRHYAEPGMLNEELAARAVERALQDRGLPAEQIGMLATGTAQGDLRVPGFASMVRAAVGRGRVRLGDGRAQGRGVRCHARRASGGRRWPTSGWPSSAGWSRRAASTRIPSTSCATTARGTSGISCSPGCAISVSRSVSSGPASAGGVAAPVVPDRHRDHFRLVLDQQPRPRAFPAMPPYVVEDRADR
jgi:hypothetical protein